jgi:hypothetical protein
MFHEQISPGEGKPPAITCESEALDDEDECGTPLGCCDYSFYNVLDC